MTAPREDASALVARVRGVLSGPPHPFQHEWSDEHTLTTADIESLCALVEQGEQDRRRTREALAAMRGFPTTIYINVDANPRQCEFEMVSVDAVLRTFDMVMPPNDSAARTGQEG